MSTRSTWTAVKKLTSTALVWLCWQHEPSSFTVSSWHHFCVSSLQLFMCLTLLNYWFSAEIYMWAPEPCYSPSLNSSQRTPSLTTILSYLWQPHCFEILCWLFLWIDSLSQKCCQCMTANVFPLFSSNHILQSLWNFDSRPESSEQLWAWTAPEDVWDPQEVWKLSDHTKEFEEQSVHIITSSCWKSLTLKPRCYWKQWAGSHYRVEKNN